MSDFWPSIRQMGELLDQWEEQRRKDERAAIEAQWTPEGLKLWRDILAQFNEMCGNKPRKVAKDVKHTREHIKAQAQSIPKKG